MGVLDHIGNRKSATERVLEFVRKLREYTGLVPTRVVVFSEDYDALDWPALAQEPYRIERGPSIQEYVKCV